MMNEHAARHAPRRVRQYLTTTPTQHYTDQAKLALFDELVDALRYCVNTLSDPTCPLSPEDRARQTLAKVLT